jgi:hypothetical protein
MVVVCLVAEVVVELDVVVALMILPKEGMIESLCGEDGLTNQAGGVMH